jgi:hypothetical protein
VFPPPIITQVNLPPSDFGLRSSVFQFNPTKALTNYYDIKTQCRALILRYKEMIRLFALIYRQIFLILQRFVLDH